MVNDAAVAPVFISDSRVLSWYEAPRTTSLSAWNVKPSLPVNPEDLAEPVKSLLFEKSIRTVDGAVICPC